MRYWTIRIGNKWIQVNLYQIIGGAVIVCGLFFFSISTALLSINSNLNAAKLLKEKRRAADLDIDLNVLKQKLDSINAKLELIIDLDNKERMVWGLQTIKNDIRKLGIGGRQINNRNSPTGAVRESIEALKRKLNFEVASFKEIYNEVDKKKKILLNTPSIWPAKGTISSEFGWRWFSSGKGFHKGIDISNSHGTPVMVTSAGIVDYVGHNGGLGLIVEIDHGFGYRTRYGHLSEALVEIGQIVTRSQVIGTMGSSGKATGPHLHYEIFVQGEEVDPMRYIIPGTTTY